MRCCLLFCFVVFLAACESPAEKVTYDTIIRVRPYEPPNEKNTLQGVFSYDSIFTFRIDTHFLERKRNELMNQFILLNPSVSPESDTLLDINFDGYDDYLIYYTTAAGVGLKNATEVYLYHKSWKGYANDSLLSSLPNFSFFPEKKMLTTFYIGYEEGSGRQFSWINNQWIVTKHFGVSNNNGRASWYISSFEDGDRSKRANTKHFSEFSTVPPPEVLLIKFSKHSSSQQVH